MSGFDDTYYRNHLEPLYSDNGIYNVDKLLFNLRNIDQFNKSINSSSYFNDIIQVVTRSDDKSATDVLANMNFMDLENYNLAQALPVPESQNTSTFTKLTGAATLEYVSLSLFKSNTVLQPNALLDSIQVSNSRISAPGNDIDSMTRSHKHMNEYMRSLILSTGKTFYKKVLDNIRSDPTMKNTTDPWNESRYSLVYLPESKLNTMIDSIGEFASTILGEIIGATAVTNLQFNANSSTKPDQKKYISMTFLDDLQDGNFKGPLYYKLRTSILNRFKIPKNTFNSSNTNSNLYFKMLAVDAYLKACYPVLIYDYIDGMMTLYTEYGDFVNSRVALLAKVMFTYYFFTKIISNYTNQDPSHIGEPYNSQITNILSKMKRYLDNVNNIDMNNIDTNVINTIAKDLHQTSNTVVDKNQQIQVIKEELKTNQLAMRNIIFNKEQLNKQYKKKIVQFIILLAILILLITTCSVLLFFATETNKLKNYVIYVAGTIASLLLLYKVIELVAYLVKSGQKSS